MGRVGSALAGIFGLGAAVVLGMTGCSKSGGDGDAMLARTPQEAATQLEKAFVQATPEAKQNAGTASEAMRSGDYEKAVVSLQAIRQGKGITLEQGLAIHSSMVSLEGKLINAIEAGDPNAKRAYELLKRMKRD